MKKFKKLSVILSLVLCMNILFSGNVFANSAETKEYEKDYTIIYSAEEITDTNRLVEMNKSGIYKMPSNNISPKVRVYSQIQNSDNNDNNDNTVYQLLTKKLYKNGNIESDYVATTLITDDMLKSSRATFNNTYEQKTGTGLNVAVKHKFYYSWSLDSITAVKKVKPIKISTTVLRKEPMDSVSFSQMYLCSWQMGVYQLDGRSSVSTPTINQEYVLNVTAKNGVSPQYVSMTGATNMYSGCTVKTNGYTFEVKTVIPT